jgi:crotonobetainyl-CoA:carnitine CoA-transferase CaiB-like acyl-CoA transferase
VHASLLHSQVAMMDFQVARYLNDGDIPVQVGNDHPTSSPMGLFEAADGHFNLGASGEGNWLRLCEVLQQPQWLAEPEYANEKLRVKNRARLNREITEIFKTRPVAHWVDLLNEIGVPAGPVYTVPQMFDDPQIRHLGVAQHVQTPEGPLMRLIAQPVTLERTPAGIANSAPGWGEHTDEMLREAGYADDDIVRLRAEGVV